MKETNKFIKVDSKTFLKSLDNSKNVNSKIKSFVHTYKLSDYDNMDCYLNVNYNCGYAIKNGDIVSLFSSVKGMGEKLINSAIVNGGVKLDCFDGYLTKLYYNAGFNVDKIETNWNGSNFPNVVYMKLENK